MTRRPETPAQPQSPGAFTSDGSWNERAELAQRGHIHALTKALCGEVAKGLLPPLAAAEAIVAANAQRAFPNHAKWMECADWALVPTSTSAEEAVKRAGQGSEERHWCGGLWKPGKEIECKLPGHWRDDNPQRMRELNDTLERRAHPRPAAAEVQAFEDVPPSPKPEPMFQRWDLEE